MCKPARATINSPSLLSNMCCTTTTKFESDPHALQMEIPTSESSSPSKLDTQHDTLILRTAHPVSPKTSSLFTTCDLYAIRKQLQKVEFFTCWFIAFLMATTNTSPAFTFAVACFKLSVVTRFFAYILDFSNAYEKLDGSIPMWLILHHSGVLAQHTIKAFLLTPTSQYDAIVFALGSQSSHNTWTKKLSLVLYWGNVLVGVICSSYFHFSHGESQEASCFFWSLVVILLGISLLVRDTISKKSKMA